MPDLPHQLFAYQPELLRIATLALPKWLRRVLDPEDLVSQTVCEALQIAAKLAAMPPAQARSYLKTMLRNNLTDAIRKHDRQREVSAAVSADSSIHLGEKFAADQTSPSVRAERLEWLARLADALNALPDAQRVAVEMKFIRGLRVQNIARELGRSPGAVSLLLNRALAAMRDVLTEPNT